MSFFVYILRTSAGTLYTGQTNNLEKRLQEHREKKGRGAKYTRAFSTFDLVYTQAFATRSEAMKREIEIKKMTKVQKEKLVSLYGTEYNSGI